MPTALAVPIVPTVPSKPVAKTTATSPIPIRSQVRFGDAMICESLGCPLGIGVDPGDGPDPVFVPILIPVPIGRRDEKREDLRAGQGIVERGGLDQRHLWEIDRDEL